MYKDDVYYGYIYLITCLVNGKYYVGQTRNEIYDRWAGHKHDARRREYHTAIEMAIKKYGQENFVVNEIEKVEASSFEELIMMLNEKEIFYIKEYHSLTHENGYNISVGGNYIGCSLKNVTYCYSVDGKLINVFESRADAGKFIGKRGEDVSGAILRHGLCGGYYFSNSPEFDYVKPFTFLNIRVLKYDISGNVIDVYDNYQIAAKSNNIDPANVYAVCTGKGRSASGYIYRFDGDDFRKYKLPARGRSVNLYDKNQYINTFETIKDCANYIKIRPSNVSAVLSTKYVNSKTVRGFSVYYADDPNQPDKTKIIAA